MPVLIVGCDGLLKGVECRFCDWNELSGFGQLGWGMEMATVNSTTVCDDANRYSKALRAYDSRIRSSYVSR